MDMFSGFNESALNVTSMLLKETSSNYTTVASCKAAFKGVVFSNYVLGALAGFLVVVIAFLAWEKYIKKG